MPVLAPRSQRTLRLVLLASALLLAAVGGYAFVELGQFLAKEDPLQQVSSKYHLRRLTLAARRELRGTDVEVLARGSRYDRATPDRWWTGRRDVRTLAAEVPKLIA